MFNNIEFFVFGTAFGTLLMFAARLLDKDITCIVERYEKTGSVMKKKPIIIPPSEPKTPKEFIEEIMDL